MEWSDEFFTERRLTSKLKHLVLRRYVKEFAYHLGSINPTGYYVDGFAGAGVYTGPPQEEGSLRVIARLAREIRTGLGALSRRVERRRPPRLLVLQKPVVDIDLRK